MKKLFLLAILFALALFVGAIVPVSAEDLVVGVNGSPVRLLPFKAVGRLNEIINTMLFESLTSRGTDDSLVGLLAESYEAVDDVTWKFKLRDGITFSDGTPLTANDVKFTYDMIMDPEVGSPHKTFMGTVAAIDVLDDQNFTITTSQPDVMLPLRVSDIYGSVISQKHYEEIGADDYDKSPLGTGPYVLEEWVLDSHISFLKNENYWGADKPVYDRITLKFLPDDATRIAALQAGEVDLITNVPPALVPEIEATEGLKIISGAGTRAHYLITDVTKPPFDNELVRKAVARAIDRDALIKVLYQGYGVPIASIFIPQTFGYDPDIVPVYNPEEAKQLLVEAGYPDGFEFGFDSFTGSITDHSKVAEAVAGMLEKVGMKANLRIQEQGVFGPLRLENKTLEMYNYSFGDSTFDHGLNLKTFVSGAQGYYWVGDDALVAKIDAALAEFDEAKRAELYGEIIGEFVDKGIIIGLFRQDQIFAAKDSVDYPVQSDETFRFFRAKPAN